MRFYQVLLPLILVLALGLPCGCAMVNLSEPKHDQVVGSRELEFYRGIGKDIEWKKTTKKEIVARFGIPQSDLFVGHYEILIYYFARYSFEKDGGTFKSMNIILRPDGTYEGGGTSASILNTDRFLESHLPPAVPPQVPQPPAATEEALLSPNIPGCPYAFLRIARDRLEYLVSRTRDKLGVPVTLQGPYTVEILDWIEKNPGIVFSDTTVFRTDLVDASKVALLKQEIAQGREVYYYEWYSAAESGTPEHGQSGFVVFDNRGIVDILANLLM